MNKKLNYVKQSTIKKILDTVDWLLVLGERSNGKSYACKNLVISECIKNDSEFIYLRRYELDCKDSLCVNYFGDVPVESMTDGEYSCIDVFRKGIFLANVNPDTGKIERGKRIGHCHALSASEHYKSLAFPNVEYIIYEELISQDGRYLYNEQNKLQHYASTIYRNRKGKILMIGNSISRICPYYREWNLKVAKQKQGTVERYVFHNDNGDDTKLAVYLTDSMNVNSGMFFGLSANNITKGAYEVEEQPHLPKSIIKYKILYTMIVEYNEFMFMCQLLQDKEDANNVTWYIQPKTSEIQEGTRVVSNKFNVSPLYTQSIREALNQNERRVIDMLLKGKVCFSDNLTGTEFNNILQYVR